MSDSLTISGTVETALPLETFDSGFTKRVLVVNTGGDYRQLLPVEFVKDSADLITGLRKGQQVTVHINLRGREWNGKYFCNIQGWRIEKGQHAETGDGPPADHFMEEKPEPAKATAGPNEEESDSIPF